MAVFENFFENLLRKEGGFVDHPLDPGGATNKGIILVNWQKWGRDIDRDGDIDVADLKLITDKDAFDYYKRYFWDKINAGLIKSQELANMVFDFYVNATSVAVPLLQHLLNVRFGTKLAVDGVAGSQTIAAANAVNAALLHDIYKDARNKYYLYRTANLSPSDSLHAFFKSLRISERSDQRVFLAGWLKRVSQFPDLVKKKRVHGYPSSSVELWEL